MYMKNTFLLLSWLILLPSGILANPIKEMLERIDKGASVYLANLHTSFLCNLIYPTFSRILLYSC